MSTASEYLSILPQQVTLYSNSSLLEPLHCFFFAVFFSYDYHIISQAGHSPIGLSFGPDSSITIRLSALSHLSIYIKSYRSFSHYYSIDLYLYIDYI